MGPKKRPPPTEIWPKRTPIIALLTFWPSLPLFYTLVSDVTTNVEKKNQRNVYWNYAYFPFFSKISTLVDNLRILSCIWNWSVARTSSKSLPWWRRRAKRWCEDTSKISICRHKACTNCLLLLQTEEDQNHLDIKRLSYHFAVHSLLRTTVRCAQYFLVCMEF